LKNHSRHTADCNSDDTNASEFILPVRSVDVLIHLTCPGVQIAAINDCPCINSDAWPADCPRSPAPGASHLPATAHGVNSATVRAQAGIMQERNGNQNGDI